MHSYVPKDYGGCSAQMLCRIADEQYEHGQYHEAIQTYRRAIEAAPAYAPAYNNLAVTLSQCGFHQEALTACEMALANDPESAESYANKGIALKGLGRVAEAETAYRQSLAINPDQAATYSSLASLLTSMGRDHEAVTAYRRALAINPRLHEARLKLTMLLPPQAGGQQCGQTFETALDELAAAAAEDLPGLGAVVGTAQPFALAYRPGDHTAALARYGTIVCRARAAWFEAAAGWCAATPLPAAGRLRLLIVSGQISNHSVWNVLLHGLLKHLDRTRFEVVLYNTASHQTAEAHLAESLVDYYRFGPRNWVSQARSDHPDVIFFPEISMDAVTTQLATLRLAPLQLAGWGHPITSGLPTIDLYLSGELLEPPDAGHHYRERLVRLPGTGACSILPPVTAVTPNPQHLELPPDRSLIRFLICQQAAKLNPAFDHLYPQIAHAVPACRFWFVRDNQVSWQSCMLEERLRHAFDCRGLPSASYLRFIDWQPAGHFLGLLDSMDVYLDPPAFSGYTTAWQALHRGLPVVTLEGRFMRQRLAAGLLRRIGITATIAGDEQDYCARAIRLASDPYLRGTLRQTILASIGFADEDTAVVRAFEQLILDNCSRR